MKKILLIICIAPIGMTVFAQGLPEIDKLKFEWEMYELDNGLRVFLQEDKEAETVSIELWTDTGARHEQTGRYGMGHFFEHATPYGLSDNIEKRDSLLDNLEDSNAQLRMDFTTYYLETTITYLPLAVEYMADRLKADPNSYINDRRTEIHRENVLNEIERNSDWPTISVQARTPRLAGIFGPHHPYGHGGYGYVEDNKRITKDELRRWYRANFRPEYSTLFIIGSFDKEAVKKDIQEQFGEIEGGARVEEIERREVVSAGGSQKVLTNYEQFYMSKSWAVSHLYSDDAAALELVSRIFEKRLSEAVKNKLFINEAGSLDETEFYQLAGHFGIYAKYDEDNSESDVRSLLQLEVDKLLSDGVKEEELKKAKEEAIVSIENRLAKLGFIGSRTRIMGKSLFFTGDPDAYLKKIDQQMKLTKSEIDTVIKEYLSKPHFELIMVPKGN